MGSTYETPSSHNCEQCGRLVHVMGYFMGPVHTHEPGSVACLKIQLKDAKDKLHGPPQAKWCQVCNILVNSQLETCPECKTNNHMHGADEEILALIRRCEDLSMR